MSRPRLPMVVVPALFALAVVVLVIASPTYEQLVDTLVLPTAIEATLFVLIYGATTHWWTTWIGRALLTSSLGLALLLDTSLLNRWFGFVLPDWGLIVMLVVIFGGATLKLTALLTEKYDAWHTPGV